MPEVSAAGSNLIKHRKWRRIHGFQTPLHPQQVIAWFLLIYFLLLTFFAVIPAFDPWAVIGLNVLHGVLYSVFFVCHVASMVVDPSVANLRNVNSKKPVPTFDRSKFVHVIENGRCHLCDIPISSPRTKHCSVCNKCVDVFDHHCKWLNQCIGKRNYWWFIASVVLALTLALVFCVLAFTLAGLHFGNGDQTRTFNSTTVYNRTFVFFNHNVDESVYFSVVISSSVIALVAAALLIHLCVFHAYIKYVGITTYEFVRSNMVEQDACEVESNPDSAVQWEALERQHGDDPRPKDKRLCCSRQERVVHPENITKEPLPQTNGAAPGPPLESASRSLSASNSNENLNNTTLSTTSTVLARTPSTVPKLPVIHPANGSVKTRKKDLETLEVQMKQVNKPSRHQFKFSSSLEDNDAIFVIDAQ